VPVLIDLHTHSAVSDGTQTPEQLVVAAARAGLDVVALTDHDSTGGWQEAARAATVHGVALVRGTEISCALDGVSVHLLSYLQDPEHPGLRAEIARTRDSRERRAERMVELIGQDVPLTWDDVLAQVADGATIGRPHIADALVANGLAANRSAAFAGILSSRSHYYVRHHAPTPVDAVRLVRAAGGVPVMAHPLAHQRGRVVGDDVIGEMVDAGLAGLEVDHRDNDDDARAHLRELAAHWDLLVTGSSDYHGAGKPNLLGENTTRPEVLARIEAQALERGVPVVR
jgi:predicted metal-dependent phosphoesterase TrpH